MIDPIERLSYSMMMDAERRLTADTHNPWPRGRAIQPVRDFTERHADPGWVICAHQGLLFVQDAPQDGSEPRVWLGNDSLHSGVSISLP